VHNLVGFTTTFEFQQKYFWNLWNGVGENDLFGFEKNCEISSTRNKVI